MANRAQTETWVTAAREGDSLAIAKLLATIHPRLRARADARMGPDLKATSGPDDVLQDVYLRVFRGIDRFEDRGPDSFLNWVYAILDHALTDARRAAHRRVRDVDRQVPVLQGNAAADSCWNLLDHVYADSGTPSRAVRREEALGAVLDCLSGLSEAHRQVVQWRFFDGLSVAEVAARLSKSEAAVVALSQRALRALRDALARHGDITRGG